MYPSLAMKPHVDVIRKKICKWTHSEAVSFGEIPDKGNSFAIAADIEEMLMHIMILKRNRGALRFRWWPDNDMSEDPVKYQTVVHSSGATSSLFDASNALRRKDFRNEYDNKVAKAIANKFYTDFCPVSNRR
ncbi:uncharacterized protein DEA37_0003814 [Paragonimus westermani]|uniref:Uncharacterized protein n=1 Tax=Paragonimus westermani TaxID=34504 RepID=A0A5J4NN46_9TREM|nr:uncharacterized protein DEA37_0003814 [Paragonimus westermani]